MGIGGGFLMTIYSKGERKVWALNARETAPAGAYENMFHGNSDLSQNGEFTVGLSSCNIKLPTAREMNFPTHLC